MLEQIGYQRQDSPRACGDAARRCSMSWRDNSFVARTFASDARADLVVVLLSADRDRRSDRARRRVILAVTSGHKSNSIARDTHPVSDRYHRSRRNARERSRVRAAQRSLCSYQSSCSDQPAQRRHDVHRHWCPQPGHWPRVSNVFHTAPQPPKNGSGVPALSQHHRLDSSGCHAHSGHRIRPNADSSSNAGVLTMVGVVAGPFFKTRTDISPYIVG